MKEATLFDVPGITSRIISEQAKRESELLKKIILEHAMPKIKGEITRGKLQWRGIRFVQQNNGFEYSRWIEQRGKQIGPKIIHTASINIP